MRWRFWGSPTVWTAAIVWLSYFLWAPLVPVTLRFAIINGITAAVAVAILLVYLPGVRDALIEAANGHPLRRGHYLIMGICCTWFAALSLRTTSWFSRELGYPELLESHFITFFLWMMFTGGVLHLSARSVEAGKVTPRGYILIGFAAFVGICMGLVAYLILTRGELPPAFLG